MRVHNDIKESIRLKRHKPATLKEDDASGMRQFEIVFTVDGVKSQQKVSAINIQKAEELIKKQYEGKQITFTSKKEVHENLVEATSIYANSQARYDLEQVLDFAQNAVKSYINILTFHKWNDAATNNLYDDFKYCFDKIAKIVRLLGLSKSDESLKEDLNTPASELDSGLANLLISAINDEWSTIASYNDLVSVLSKEQRHDMANVVADIINEENTHVGQLQTLLKSISPNVENISGGETEASSQMSGETVDDDFGENSGFGFYF